MTEQEFNNRVQKVIAKYSKKEGMLLEDAYRQIMSFGILLSEESMNNFEMLLELNAKHRNEA